MSSLRLKYAIARCAMTLALAVIPAVVIGQTVTLTGDYGPTNYDGSNPWNVGGDGIGDLNIGVDDDGHMTIDGTNGIAIVNSGNVLTAGRVTSSTAAPQSDVIVTGSQAQWNLNKAASFGYRGESTLTVANGGKVLADHHEGFPSTMNFGHNADSQGSLIVDGAGSELNVDGLLRFGLAGNGEGRIANGGKIQSTYGHFGLLPSAYGELNVDGVGSSFVGTDNFIIGVQGTGKINVASGGEVTMGVAFVASQDSAGVGEINVSGQGSKWSGSSIYLGGGNSSSTTVGGRGTLNVSSGGNADLATLLLWDEGFVNLSSGSLSVGNLGFQADVSEQFNFTGGRLEVTRVFDHSLIQKGGTLSPGKGTSSTLWVLDGDYEMRAGNLEILLGGLHSSQFGSVVIDNGAATLNGTIDIDWTDDFVGSAGDSFLIVDALNGITGTPTFDFSDAQLETGLFWDTSDFMNSGTIHISAVPEPSSLVILGLVACVGVVRRRHR